MLELVRRGYITLLLLLAGSILSGISPRHAQGQIPVDQSSASEPVIAHHVNTERVHTEPVNTAQPDAKRTLLPSTREISRPIRGERNLIFRHVEGTDVTADLFRPDDQAIYPLVIVIHGGAWSAGNKWQVGDHARELAQAGFVGLAINYRLAPAHRLPDQIDDCRAALRWGAEQAAKWRADASRVCLWGYSAGGHLSALLATDPQAGDPPICAVVAGGAPCDFEFVPAESSALAHVFGGTRAEIPAIYQQASPIAHVTPQSPPFFFFHGENDALVPAASSQRMHRRLREVGVESDYHLVAGRGHLLTFIDFDSRRRAIEFLRVQTTDTP